MVKNDNYSDEPLHKRLKKALPEQQFIVKQLLNLYQIDIKPASSKEDKFLKIDGWWNGEAVQIKLRKSSYNGRNDVLYEVLKDHDRNTDIAKQLLDDKRIGRDYKGQVIHYFVMNRGETVVYHLKANDIRSAVDEALKELGEPQILKTVHNAANGTQLRPTLDPYSKMEKILAFIPLDKIDHKAYSLDNQ